MWKLHRKLNFPNIFRLAAIYAWAPAFNLIWFLILVSYYFIINAIDQNNLISRIKKSLYELFQYILTLFWQKFWFTKFQDLLIMQMEMQYLLSSILNFEPVLVHWWVGLLSHEGSLSIGWNFFYPIMSKEICFPLSS